MTATVALCHGRRHRTAPEKMPTRQRPHVFAPEGALDLHVAPETRTALRELIDQKPKRLIVDLSKVPYVDSSGLAVLIGAMQSLEHDGGQFMLAGPQEAVRVILESARLDQYFHVFPDIDAATAAK